ncbi:MAG: histidinol-phosphate transaminase [Gemmatimonadota bacterium]|nr:histidinol-phosphate transaminase [Gemmatimonadota bacterium]
MDRRGFVTAGMAAGLAGLTGAGGTLGSFISRVPSWASGKTLQDGTIRLSSNENAIGLSPQAREAVIDALPIANRYPGAHRRELMERLAEYAGVAPENLVLSAGSTEILQVAAQAYRGPNKPLVLAEPTFEDIGDYQETESYDVISIPLTDGYEHDVERMREAVSGRPAVVYFCNPNNPTGTITSSEAIDAWIEEAPETTTFIMDEAYFEYVEDPRYWSAVKWVEDRRNVVVVRTFSKIFAMAGMRLGYSISHPDTAGVLREFVVQNNPNELAAAAGLASLKDDGLIERSAQVNRESKAIVQQTLDELGLEYLPTEANFLMHRIHGDLSDYQDRMREAGLLVGRHFPPMLEWNRLSFGLPDEMDRWASTIKDFRRKGWI